MSAAFDTLDAARRLEAAGMDRQHAEAVAAVVRDSRSAPATAADLPAFEVRLYRALWIQAAGIIAAIAAIAALAGSAIGLASP